MGGILELKDVTCYGVEVPGCDGRAGMLAIPVQDKSEIDFQELEKGLEKNLPSYARPLFLRLVNEADLTSKESFCCGIAYALKYLF